MPLQHHSLLKDFPEMSDKIHQLKESDHHFSKLLVEYDELDHKVFNLESGSKAASDEHLNELKSKRITLKDELYGMLKKVA